jgi:type IV pilus assembly protein PilB
LGIGLKPEQFCSLGLEKVLIRLKIATKEQIRAAYNPTVSHKAIATLADAGLFDEDGTLDKVARSLGLTRVSTAELEADQGRWDVDIDVLKRHSCVPLRLSGQSNNQLVVFADPLDRSALAAMEFLFGGTIVIGVARERDILARLEHLGGSSGLALAVDSVAELSNSEKGNDRSSLGQDDVNTIVQGSESAPVVRLVNQIISDAFARNASDIHVEPSRGDLEIKFRIDGVVVPQLTIPKRLQTYVTTRLKLMAKMDITERRRPQDGRFRAKAKTGIADLRVSSVPTPFGEKIVLRVLDSDVNKLRLELLGLDEDLLQRFRECLTARDRLVLVSGPTGSGKSTTLYSAIQSIKQGDSTIVTVEDPIEYSLQGITQIQVNSKIGMTFASCLRSIMRQDPDVILLGEVRDQETAEIAFQAAQTGHLVLTTLHTNSAAASIIRLVDLGIEPYLIAPSLGAVMAQRLLRKLCDSCAKSASDKDIDEFEEISGTTSPDLRSSVGCKHCHDSGYKGRIGVYSLLVVDKEIRELIRSGASEETLEASASRNGMLSLFESGLRLVERGITTVEELERVIGAGVRREHISSTKTKSDSQPKSRAKAQVRERIEPEGFSSLEDLRDSFVVSEDTLSVSDASKCEADAELLDLDSLEERAAGSIEDLVASHNGIASLGVGLLPKVLFVDDDSGVRAVMVRALRKADFEVCEAEDGLDAIKKLEGFTPDVVVSDLVMPRLDGKGFIEKLRKMPQHKDLPVIVLTGSDTEDNEVLLLKAGANDFVSKGSSPAVVIARITRLLDS